MSQPWLERSTKLFLSALEGLQDDAFAEPSALPGWTRSHVVAHVHFNAVALMRLMTWATTGRENPMYGSMAQRAREIEEGARLPISRLRQLVHESAAELSERFEAMSDSALAALVVTAQGRTVPAAEIAWMRTRETAIHSIDLKAGVRWSDLGDDLNQALATEALMHHGRAGHLAELTAWLTGRAPVAPRIGRWL